MKFWDMYKTYGNIVRLRQILTVLIRHGFSHFLHQIRIFEYAPWLGRFIEPKPEERELATDLPSRLAHAFQELGPAFIKLGQLLATRPDIVPAPFQRAFAKLQDDVDPLPGEEVTPILEKALGKPVSGVFSMFDDKAAASGSIGQAHFAELLDGSPVVVKIKRPGIDKRIEDDLSLLESLAVLVERHVPELAVIRPAATLGEFRRVMNNELDFVGEASCTAKFRETLGENRPVKVPVVYWDYACREVLVTERLSGTSLAQSGGLSRPERERIAGALVDCFMRQYFETGFFHADPHPGNIFVMPDGGIGLLDFGQVGHLSDDLRHILASILIALREGGVDVMVDLYSEVGEFAPDSDIQGFRGDLAGLLDRNYGVPADRIDFAALMQDALSAARRNGLYLPRDFVLLAKSLVTIAGVVRDLDPAFRLDEAVKPFVRRLAAGMYNPANVLKRAWRVGSKFMGLFRRMPEDARDLMEKAKAGKFTIVFHHENLQGVVERTSRAVDRLTLGIIIASVVISSSIILVSGPGNLPGGGQPVFLGLPLTVLIAALGFVGALVVGAYVAWGIFRDKT